MGTSPESPLFVIGKHGKLPEDFEAKTFVATKHPEYFGFAVDEAMRTYPEAKHLVYVNEPITHEDIAALAHHMGMPHPYGEYPNDKVGRFVHLQRKEPLVKRVLRRTLGISQYGPSRERIMGVVRDSGGAVDKQIGYTTAPKNADIGPAFIDQSHIDTHGSLKSYIVPFEQSDAVREAQQKACEESHFYHEK